MTLDPAQLPDDIAISEGDGDRGREEGERPRGWRSRHLKLTIAKLQRNTFGASSERGARSCSISWSCSSPSWSRGVAEDKAAAEIAGAARPRLDKPEDEQRRKPARRPLPEHLPRERSRASGTVGMPVLRRDAAQARRGHHRDAGARAGAVEGDPARAREVRLPADARPSRSRRRRRIRSRAAGPGRSCWPRCCSPSTGRTCRSTGRATSMPTKASISTSRRWPTGSAPAPRR